MEKDRHDLEFTKQFIQVVHELRQKCPWDRKQTHQSLAPYLLEEAYETVEAIEKGDPKSMEEELGDVLLQIALHSEIAQESGAFDFESVSQKIKEKMVRRHPHVFEDVEVKDEKTHLANWAKYKQSEKSNQSTLEGIPKSLPALQQAQKIGATVAVAGFDWPEVQGVLDKLNEEKDELVEAYTSNPKDKRSIELELGDLLFTVVNLARHLKVDAETALRGANRKFMTRFALMEDEIRSHGKKLSELSPSEMEGFWQDAKNKSLASS